MRRHRLILYPIYLNLFHLFVCLFVCLCVFFLCVFFFWGGGGGRFLRIFGMAKRIKTDKLFQLEFIIIIFKIIIYYT